MRQIIVVGAGVLGLSVAYYLARAGLRVQVLEGKKQPGGLLDYVNVDGAWIDKYYHCILSSDSELLTLVREIGLEERVRFRETRQGVYYGGRLYPMANARDFLLFPPLTLMERFRLGLSILLALRTGDYRELDTTPVESWLVRLGGRGVFDKLWGPLLRAKFDGDYRQVPASYIWSRIRRTSSTRKTAAQKELMGYFVGSYKVLVERLVEQINSLGSSVVLGAKVNSLAVESGAVCGVEVDGERIPGDTVVVTAPLPVLHRLLPERYRDVLAGALHSQYLGVVCGLLLLDRPLSPFYALNIADGSVPLTGVIETTNLIDPAHVGGYHLVYLPKYVRPGSSFLQHSDAELKSRYLFWLGKMFPGFREDGVRHVFVFRERFVEPLHLIGQARPVLPFDIGLPGLVVVNNGQIYPELTNCQASVRHALRALPAVLASTSARVEGWASARGGV